MPESIELMQIVALIIPGIAIFLQFYYSDILGSEEAGKITIQGGLSEIHTGYLLVLVSFSLFILSAIFLSTELLLAVVPSVFTEVGLLTVAVGFVPLLFGMLYPILGPELWTKIVQNCKFILQSAFFALLLVILVIYPLIFITAVIHIEIVELPLDIVGRAYAVLYIILATAGAYVLTNTDYASRLYRRITGGKES
jgi:hypothetical protein